MNGGQGLMSSPLIKADFESDVTFHFDKLVTSTGKEIRNANDANDYQPAMGETINIYYTFEIMATKDYGPGSFFTFQLPQVLLAFKESTLSGDIDHGDIQLKYSTDNGIVTVVMSEGELYNTNELSNGQLHFTATFVKNSANDELEQTLE